jgi:hypothetical protein
MTMQNCRTRALSSILDCSAAIAIAPPHTLPQKVIRIFFTDIS